jgi:hypothetical protein
MKKIFVEFILAKLIIFNSGYVLCQTDSVQNKLTYNYTTDDSFSKIRSIEVVRRFVNDSIFIDEGILCDDISKKCELKFSKRDYHWMIWSGNEWMEMFDDKNHLRKIYLANINRTISAKDVYIFNGDTLYSFSCKDEGVNFSSDSNKYIFSKNEGVIAINTVETIFIRSDYIASIYRESFRKIVFR